MLQEIGIRLGAVIRIMEQRENEFRKKNLSLFNRLLIFDTGKHSYHGHPQPLNCPKNKKK